MCPLCCSPGPPTGSVPRGSCGKAPRFWETLDNTRLWLSQPQFSKILQKVSGVAGKKGKKRTKHEAVCAPVLAAGAALSQEFFSSLGALGAWRHQDPGRNKQLLSKKAAWGPFAREQLRTRSFNPQHSPAAPGWRTIRAGHAWTPPPLQRPKPVPTPAKIPPKSLQCFLEKNQSHLPLHPIFPLSCHSSRGLLN